MRILVLLTDAFGGHGGIAKFNRDLLTALCAHPDCEEVVALPRLMPESPGDLPEKLTWTTAGLGGKLHYLRAIIESVVRSPWSRSPVVPWSRSPAFDLIICAHINLLPLAFLAKLLVRTRSLLPAPRSVLRAPCSLLLTMHGIEAWTPHRSWIVRRLLHQVDAFISVSEFTKQKFLAWTGLRDKQFFILPDSVDLSAYGAGSKDPALLSRYGLDGRKVIMTLARLSSAERYKGIDEVLEAMPALTAEFPDLCYLICGDGDDRERLAERGRALGLDVSDQSSEITGDCSRRSSACDDGQSVPSTLTSDLGPLTSGLPTSDLRPLTSHQTQVIFAGYIPEAEKPAHLRLADAFVMPGWGEGFGIVYLEAMACGVPVVASKADASQEAVRNGELGVLVDPKDPSDLRDGILAALRRPRGIVPQGLEYFSAENFAERCHQVIDSLGCVRQEVRGQRSEVRLPCTVPQTGGSHKDAGGELRR